MEAVSSFYKLYCVTSKTAILFKLKKNFGIIECILMFEDTATF
jgi:hypothetical protein